MLTTKCSRAGHPEFELSVGTLPAPLVEFLVDYLEDSVAEGRTFKAGQHIQIGSGVMRVGAQGKHLTLLERVPGTDKWDVGVTRTMMAMYRQRCVLESFDMVEQLSFPAPGSGALACTRHDTASVMGFKRGEPQADDDSGWVVLCNDDHDHNKEDNLLFTRIETLCERQQWFELFLAMPAGTLVVRDAGAIAMVELDGEPLEVQPGTMLDEMRKQFGWPLG
ncbi:MAG TPA: DUF2185 domain-containing protein [Kofleriaceae bacterium]|jgi:hypothetical protein